MVFAANEQGSDSKQLKIASIKETSLVNEHKINNLDTHM